VIQKPRPNQTIIIYLSVSKEVVSAVLVQKVDKEERSVYFINQMLHVAETRYQMIEKVSLALVKTFFRPSRSYTPTVLPTKWHVELASSLGGVEGPHP